LTGVTQLRDTSGIGIDPATLNEQQALKKGTWDLTYSAGVTITASGTWFDILTLAGPAWVVSCGFYLYGGPEASANGQPVITLDGNMIQPWEWTTWLNIVTRWALTAGTDRAKVTQNDTTNDRYSIICNFAARPVWVPSGITFKLRCRNTHATNNFTGKGYIEASA
jgi:hypothetical protein